MRLHQICEGKNQVMASISGAIRKMARNRSQQTNADRFGETHYTPDDEDDLYQLGMMAAWEYLSSRDNRNLITGNRTGFLLALKTANNAMARNGTRNIRITGSLPYAVPTQNTYTASISDYDVNQLPNTKIDRIKLIDQVRRALDKVPANAQSKQYFLKQLEGFGPTEIGQMFGVSKTAVSNVIKRLTPLVQQALEESIYRYSC